jgi:hypothetical protein
MSRIGVGSVCSCRNARTSAGRGRVAVGSENGSAEDGPSKTRESENGAPIGARDVGGTPLGTASVLTMCPEEEHRRSSPHRPSISASARRDRSGTLRHLSRRRGQIRRTATLVTNVMRGGMKSARREGPKSSPSTCTCRQRTHSERPRTSRPNEDEQLLQVRPAQR